MLKRILLLILVLLVLLQFYRPSVTPPADAPASVSVASLFPDAPAFLGSACFDCHSYDSRLPWYAYVNPPGFLVRNHIREGREHLNFSLYKNWTDEERVDYFKECAEEVEKGNMPLKGYTWLHPAARLSEEERVELARWFKEKARQG